MLFSGYVFTNVSFKFCGLWLITKHHVPHANCNTFKIVLIWGLTVLEYCTKYGWEVRCDPNDCAATVTLQENTLTVYRPGCKLSRLRCDRLAEIDITFILFAPQQRSDNGWHRVHDHCLDRAPGPAAATGNRCLAKEMWQNYSSENIIPFSQRLPVATLFWKQKWCACKRTCRSPSVRRRYRRSSSE